MVRAYYQRVFRPDLTTIVVIGKVTPEAARAAIGKYFGAWSADGPAPAIDLPPAPANRAGIDRGAGCEPRPGSRGAGAHPRAHAFGS